VRLYLINTGNIPFLIGAIVVPALESYLYPLIITLLLIGALMDALLHNYPKDWNRMVCDYINKIV
jgi:hypothetical protein